MPGRSVMVVGGAGFVGSHLVDRLLATGSDRGSVDVVDDLSTGTLANLADARTASDGRLRIHTFDASSPEFIDLVTRASPAAIVVTAAFNTERSLAHGAARSYALVVSVLEAARVARVGKVIVTVPAVALYGDAPARELPLKEDHARRPVGTVGVTVESVLGLLDHFRRDHNVDFTALALATVYGPRQRPDAGVVAGFLSAAHEGRDAVVHGDGRQTRDLLYVDDAVDALHRSVDRGGGLLLNIGTGQQTSVRELWSMIGGSRATVSAPARPFDVRRSAVSPSRARLQLGWAPWTGVADGVVATAASLV